MTSIDIKRYISLSFLTMIIMFTSSAYAAQSGGPMPVVARKASCTNCHKIEKKLIGPAFVWVADKYKDDKEAGRKAIIDQIINGGQGKWTKYTKGAVMPSYGSTTTEAQRDELADFILGLEPIAPSEQ